MADDFAEVSVTNLIEQARAAVTELRDAAREGRVIDFRKRDPLVMAIHRALDLVESATSHPARILKPDGSQATGSATGSLSSPTVGEGEAAALDASPWDCPNCGYTFRASSDEECDALIEKRPEIHCALPRGHREPHSPETREGAVPLDASRSSRMITTKDTNDNDAR